MILCTRWSVTTVEDMRGSSGEAAAANAGVSASKSALIRPVAVFSAVFLLYSLVTLVFFWPEIAHLHTALIGPPEDNLNDFWDTWYLLVGHNTAHFFRTNLLRFPEGTSLIYQSFAWPQLFAVFLLSRLLGTDLGTLTALQNLTVLASFPLAGAGAFYLVRHFTHSAAGALIGGFVFAFNPSHVAHVMHHAGVSSIEFLPFFALFYLIALERRSNLWLGLAALFYAFSALSCWYYLFYCGYFMGFQLLYQRVRDGAWPRGWVLEAPLRCAIWTAVLLSPLLVPMVLSARPSLYEGGGNDFVADLSAYFTFPPEHLLSALGQGLYRRFTGYPWEATVYLGLVNLAVLVWVCIRTGLARTSLGVYVLFGMIFFAILASGEALHVAGTVTFIHLPDAILDRLPFLANVRSPSRIIVFTYLFLAIGIGFAAATALRDHRAIACAAVAATTVLIALDFYPAHVPMTSTACSKGLDVLKGDQERGFGVFDLPISYAAEDTYMHDQICDGRPLVVGVTAREMGQTLINRLSLTDVRKQQEQLRQAHVKYLVIHKPRNGLYAWNKFLPPLAEYLGAYRLAYSDPELLVLRVY